MPKREKKADRDTRLAADARVNAAIEDRLSLFDVLSFIARMDDAIEAAKTEPNSVELMKLKQLNGKRLGDLTREDCLWQASVIDKAWGRLKKIKAEARKAERKSRASTR